MNSIIEWKVPKKISNMEETTMKITKSEQRENEV